MYLRAVSATPEGKVSPEKYSSLESAAWAMIEVPSTVARSFIFSTPEHHHRVVEPRQDRHAAQVQGPGAGAAGRLDAHRAGRHDAQVVGRAIRPVEFS